MVNNRNITTLHEVPKSAPSPFKPQGLNLVVEEVEVAESPFLELVHVPSMHQAKWQLVEFSYIEQFF